MTQQQTITIENPTFWGAADLAKAGYSVFPVFEKEPTVKGGLYAATTDLSQIASLIEAGHGDDDVAFATGLVSLVVVIDADTLAAYEKMQAKHGEPHVKTKRGGHWYFRHPQDGKVPSRNLEPGLDCKGDGGYAIAPPSRNRFWTSGIPDPQDLPILPKELREVKKQWTEGERSSADPVGEVIPEGKRNETITSLAGTMRRRGMGEEEILGALVVTNQLRCEPPLDDEELRRTVRSVAQYEPAKGPWWVKVVAKNG